MMQFFQKVALAVSMFIFLTPAPAEAYPEYQLWSQQVSGRNVNCGMCHSHPDGPDGLKPGQIGSLTADQLVALGAARSAFEPGARVNSPILNTFGNSLVEQVGRRELIALRVAPENISEKLDPKRDLDGDGLADARELREGTDPLDPQSGSPWTLLKINLWRQRFHLLMVALATISGLYGLHHLLRGLHRMADRPSRTESKR